MTARISDERLAELRLAYALNADNQREIDVASGLAEAEQSRALVTALRAMAERMRESRRLTAGNRDKYHATNLWLSELDSLLSAHGSAHIQAVAAQATREGIIGIDFDAKAQPAPYKHCPECGEHLSMHKIPCGAAQTEKDAEGAR